MKRLDLRKTWKHLYQPSAKKVEIVEVPELLFLQVDGRIERGRSPGDSPAFLEAVQALFSASYALKFQSKLRKKDPIDYPVMALEALWWVEDGNFELSKPDNWSWRAMMMQPQHITSDMLAEALEKLRVKKPTPGLDRLRMERFTEGCCVQTMHIGPYSTEPATLVRMRAFAQAQGYALANRHHEIYLSDPRRCAPGKMKTVLRHGVEESRSAAISSP
jgi:hypothetical protein